MWLPWHCAFVPSHAVCRHCKKDVNQVLAEQPPPPTVIQTFHRALNPITSSSYPSCWRYLCDCVRMCYGGGFPSSSSLSHAEITAGKIKNNSELTPAW